MTISLEEARRLMVAVSEEAEQQGVRLAVVVVDGGGHLVGVNRMDGAFLSAVRIAEKKAFTAVNFGQATHAMAERLRDTAYQGLVTAADERLTFLKGGLPIERDGQVVGGIGASGGTGDEDHACCEAALRDWKG